MLISKFSNPKSSIYYLSAQILKELKNKNLNTNVVDLFIHLKNNINPLFTYANYILALDWLFLLGAIRLNNEKVILCISNN